jgi:hypothetical protein
MTLSRTDGIFTTFRKFSHCVSYVDKYSKCTEFLKNIMIIKHSLASDSTICLINGQQGTKNIKISTRAHS